MDEEELQSKFEALNVKSLTELSIEFNPAHAEKVIVNMESKEVCDTVCTLSELEDVVNAWSYDFEAQTCTCAWLTEIQTCHKYDNDWYDIQTGTVAFIQLARSMPCSN